MSTDDPRMVAALLRERESCERMGRMRRVAEIDEQLALHGHEVERPVERATPEEQKQTASDRPAPRKRAPRKRTAAKPSNES